MASLKSVLSLFSVILLTFLQHSNAVPFKLFSEDINFDLPEILADSAGCKDDRDCSFIVKNVEEGEKREKYCNYWKHKTAIQQCRKTCNFCEKAPSPIECDEPADCSILVDITGGGEALTKYCTQWKDDEAVKECKKTCGFPCSKPPSPPIEPVTAKPATKKPTEKPTEKLTEKPTQPSGENLSGFEKACLEAHNDLRSFHGSPALKWSAQLTRAAQSWADYLAATDKFEHDLVALGQGQGENLYYKTYPKRLCGYGEQGADCTSCAEIVQMWYDEEADYDYQTGKAKTIGSPILHFTQLVWKATKELGMATAVANNRLVAVARYTPRGNWGGQFQENVLEPNIVP